jgi:DNA-binding beta-propeller fold protein YncE
MANGRVMLTGAAVIAAAILSGPDARTQIRNEPRAALANPYRLIENPLVFPEGRKPGWIMGIIIDRNGEDIWVLDTCGGGVQECVMSNADPVLKFDASGRFLSSFGGGSIVHPHGVYVDAPGNVWIVDGFGGPKVPDTPGKGHRVLKFSPEGKLLLTLGTAGVKGRTNTTFNTPADVVVAPDGTIFVADGHGYGGNDRVVKFTKDGTFVKAWGTNGTAPGQFNEIHSIAMDSRGRLFVADRQNQRIQIFDQEGTLLDRWTQFGAPSEIFIDADDVMYVTDSEREDTSDARNGIYVGSAKDGRVTAFVPDTRPNQHQELVAVDKNGNLWTGYTLGKMVRKYAPTGRH